MKKDTITLAGKAYRVEINMAAIERFEESSGLPMSRFEQLAASASDKGKSIDAKIMLQHMHAGIIEGEKLDNRDCHLTLNELKQKVRPCDLSHFITHVFIPQYMGDTSKEAQKTAKKKERRKWRLLTVLANLRG